MGNEITKCTTCGGDLVPDPRTGIPTCIFCGRQHKKDVDDYSLELKEIVRLRQMREFSQAEELCKELQRTQPESSEVWWQSLLVDYGVVYVRESDKVKPTFFSYSYNERDSLLKNNDYIKAIETAASAEDRDYYKTKGEELDRLLNEFFNLVAKENSYDIFISFKKSTQVTENGRVRTVDTDDCIKAREIYNYFKDKYKVFFSPVSIGQDTGIEGEKYEPRILKALQTSQAMILVGSQTEYVTAQWVENEWRRYLHYVSKGKKQKNSLVYCYEKNMPRLPAALADIQLPNVDMYRNGYLAELEKKLSFVKSGKGLRSSIKERKVMSDFTGDESAFAGYQSERVRITGRSGHENIAVSATEEREMQQADDVRKAGRFKDAERIYGNILAKNSGNCKAYWGRFCARLRAKEEDDLKAGVSRAKPEAFDDFDNCITYSNDEKYSWSRVDVMLEALGANDGIETVRLLLDRVGKYFDEKYARRALDKLADKYNKYVPLGKTALTEKFFAMARQLFFEKNLEYNLKHMDAYAQLLLKHKKFAMAQGYFCELSAAKKSSSYYYSLLCCRLKDNDLAHKKINMPATREDASTKMPAELNIAEIVERILICAYEDETYNEVDQIEEAMFYQIANNRGKAKAFIELVAGCIKQLTDEEGYKELLLYVADHYVLTKNFKTARTYYKEALAVDPNTSKAHWGLLRCRLKALDDADVEKKRKSLMKYQEYMNATNCANNEEYEYYTKIFNGQGDKKRQNREKSKRVLKKSKKKRAGIVILCVLAVLVACTPLYIKTYDSIVYSKSFAYTLQDDDTYSVHATKTAKKIRGALKIPASYKGKPVTAVDDEAFVDLRHVTSLSLPASLKTIGRDAFRGCGIKKISLSDQNETYTLENGALYDKEKTTLMLYPYASSAATFALDDACAYIDFSALSGCKYLVTVALPDTFSVDASKEAFDRCPSLQGFAVSDENASYVVVEGALFDKATDTFYYIPAFGGAGYTLEDDLDVQITHSGVYFFDGASDIEYKNVHIAASEGATAVTLWLRNVSIRGTSTDGVVYVAGEATVRVLGVTDARIVGGRGGDAICAPYSDVRLQAYGDSLMKLYGGNGGGLRTAKPFPVTMAATRLPPRT